MRVCILIPHTKISGGTRVLFGLAKALHYKGVDVSMCSMKGKAPIWAGPLPFDVTPIGEMNKYTLPKCDVLIDFADNNPYVPMPDVKHILYLQGFGTQDFNKEARNLLYKYDAVVATTNWLAKIASRAGQDLVYTIPPGIDPIFTDSGEEKTRNIITIGSLWHNSYAKNSEMVVAAMNKFARSHPRSRLLLLSAKLPTNVDLLNELVVPYSLCVNPPQHLVPSLYVSSNIWLSTSLNEGFGLPIIEAMSCGTPTAVVPSYGLDDYLVHQENCLIVPNNKERIASSMNILIKDKDMYKKIVSGGKALAKKFNWEDTVKAFMKVLTDI